MKKRNYLLREVKDFASGAFENTAVDNGGVQLGRKGSGHLTEGSYTSPPFTAYKFRSLVPSWNADLPEGTSVELQARLGQKGSWSSWFSFGRFSPYLDRASPVPYEDTLARASLDSLTLREADSYADTAQLRVHLFSEDERLTPTVHLLALSVDAAGGAETGRPAPDRMLELPAYSALVRDPAIAGRIGSPTAITMLLNRWGEDLLPEEFARMAFDEGGGTFGNLSFLAATAGLYGYECFVSFANLATLKREVWLGNAVAAKVRYRAPALAGEDEAAPDAPPVLEGATVKSNGHLVVVRGFASEGGDTFVEILDPLAPDDNAVKRRLPLSAFLAIYTGLCVVLHRGRARSSRQKPRRTLVQMSVSGGYIHLHRQNESLIPGPFTREELTGSTLCYTLAGSVAYASNAQRMFYYPRPDEEGRLPFEYSFNRPRRVTFYRIGPKGRTWVAETPVQPDPKSAPQADTAEEEAQHDTE